MIYIDGISQGWVRHSDWSKTSISGGGTLTIGQIHPSLSAVATKTFQGRLTVFNMWNHVLEASEIAMLARGCRNVAGNLFSWNSLKNEVKGALKIVEPSSCM